MNWLQGMLFGFVTGIAEFFPISAPAHMALLKNLMGINANDPVLDLVCALAALLALISANRTTLDHIRRDQRLQMHKKRRGSKSSRISRDLKLVKTASVPMLICFVVLTYVIGNSITIPLTAVFLLLNGIILFIPSRTMQGNKDAGQMSALDGFVMGIMGGISALAGLSRIGLQTSYARFRGAKAENTVNWALLASIPALVAICAISLLAIFAGYSAIQFSCGFFTYLLVFLTTFVGSYISTTAIKFIASKNSLSLFCYYSWGAALFAFIMYLV